MSMLDKDADENELRLELYLSIIGLFSGEMPSTYNLWIQCKKKSFKFLTTPIS